MNIKKKQQINLALHKQIERGEFNSRIPLEYDVLNDGTRVLSNKGMVITALKNYGLIQRIQDNHGIDSLSSPYRTGGQLRSGYDYNWRDCLTDGDKALLESNGVTPRIAKFARKIARTIKDERTWYRREYNENVLSYSDKVAQFKESWNTMSPNRVMESVLPHGTAIGIELEYIARAKSREDDDGRIVYERGDIDFQFPDTTKELYGVSWGYDVSVSPKAEHQFHRGQEVRIMLQQGRWGRLFKLTDHLRKNKCELSKECGLHVHLDMRDLSTEAMHTRGKRFACALPWLKEIVPASRRNNRYCALGYSSTEKYYAFTSHVSSRKAIECRLHSGSLNPHKIIKWAELLLFIKDHYTPLGSMSDFMSSKAEPELKQWVVQRHYELNKLELSTDTPTETMAENE
ncbi:MAG: putative amidoligase enzyme [Prokaryotic dsDNA virus sp.]|nr:MAG: putative amidoligase enzyme [Prokaryotic dsDNA virus sp.]|tara:strand:- start:30991 stop:32196 length:1206 start_codon:yes stop_codon:yes gene_type:complete